MLIRDSKNAESGQALVEFLMMMPFVLTFTWYMLHVSMAINKSIVGQQHSRSQLFLKLFNHRHGPVQGEFTPVQRSHFFIGVAKSVMSVDTATPEAPIETMGVGANPGPFVGADNDNGEAKPGSLRQNIRVRTAFGICTHRKTLPDGNKTDFCGNANSSSGGP